MTEQIDTTDPAIITEALTVIDHALGKMLSRELISSNEVADLLLDVRTALTTPNSPDVVEVALDDAAPTPV
ncbi:hypothetical protein BH24ACT6_BH24ACT6_10890 [soil metagenome]